MVRPVYANTRAPYVACSRYADHTYDAFEVQYCARYHGMEKGQAVASEGIWKWGIIGKRISKAAA